MARWIAPRGTFEYVLRKDQSLPADSPERTVWILRALSLAEQTEIQDLAAAVADGGDSVNVRSGSLQLRTMRYGIVGVRHLIDGDGKEVRLQRERVGGRDITPDSFIAGISRDDRQELVEVIANGAQLDVDTAGKSSPPPTPSTTEG